MNALAKQIIGFCILMVAYRRCLAITAAILFEEWFQQKHRVELSYHIARRR